MHASYKHLCVNCQERRSLYSYRGRIRADRQHTLCFQCYRAFCDRLRERRKDVLAGFVL